MPQPTPQSSQDDLIQLRDASGKQISMTRQQWREKVLPANLTQVWDDPQQLSHLIIQAIEDAFYEDVLEGAKHLLQIDPIFDRSSTLLATIYEQVGQIANAEKILLDCLNNHGESPSALSNLARLYAEKAGDPESAMKLLWRSLQINPNQEIGLNWLCILCQQKDAADSPNKVLTRIAEIPNSWLARVWHARRLMELRDIRAAMNMYKQSIEIASKPIPTYLLLQVSSDLGNLGYNNELVELIEPVFDIDNHGIEVGNNIIKAYFNSGNFDRANELLGKIQAKRRPEWEANLEYWQRQIEARIRSKMEAAPTGTAAARLTTTLYRLDSPDLFSELRAKFNAEGDLVLEGQDLGGVVKQSWGEDEYEYWITVQSNHIMQLGTELAKQVHKPAPNPQETETFVIEALKILFSRDREGLFTTTSQFRMWLDKRQILHKFTSYS